MKYVYKYCFFYSPDLKPPPPVTPVTIEIPPQRPPSPPVAVLQEVPTDDTLTSRDGSALASQVPGFDLGVTSEAVRPIDTTDRKSVV